MDRAGGSLHFLRPRQTLRPDGAVGPYVRFFHVSDNASPNQLHQATTVGLTVSLIAHLGDHTGFPGNARQYTGFFDGVSEWFLTVNMHACFHGDDGRVGMGVIRRRYGDRINVLLLLLEHHAKILIDLGFGEFLEGACGLVAVHIA